MTEAEKLQAQWKRQFGNKQPPKNKDRVPGVINRSEVITVPPEQISKPRIPESSLSLQQRHNLRIRTGYVKADQDGDLFCEIQGTEQTEIISLATSDYLFQVGDCLDVLPAFQSREYRKFVIIGRRRDPAESE